MEDPLYLQINICSLGLDITKIYPISTQSIIAILVGTLQWYFYLKSRLIGLDITKIYPISTRFMSTEESIDYCNTSWYTPMIFLLEKSTNVNSHSVISL